MATRTISSRRLVMSDADMAKAYLAGASLAQIAGMCGRYYEFVRSHIRRYGVKIRSAAEGVHLAKRAVPIKITAALRELIDGILLGDGWIECSTWGARLGLGQTATRVEWLREVQRELSVLGVESTIGAGCKPRRVRIRGQVCNRRRSFTLRTANYAALKAERERWYPCGVKRVPRDVYLTAGSIANWYFGDGTVGGNGYHATFCTNGFTAADNRRLIAKLRSAFGWTPILSRNTIALCRTADRATLVKMIENRTPTCFRYKLKLRTQDRRYIITGQIERRLRQLLKSGASYANIAHKLGCSKSGVASACQRLGLI